MTKITLKSLAKVLPVPAKPIDVDESAYSRIKKALGTGFPADFIEYSRLYGTGSIGFNELYRWEIYSCFRPQFPKVAEFFRWRRAEVREGADMHDVPLALWPERNGLLPFGGIDNLYFTWRTIGKPDDWPIVVNWEYSHTGYEEFNMPFIQWLYKFLTKEIVVAGFTPEWAMNTIYFNTTVYAGE